MMGHFGRLPIFHRHVLIYDDLCIHVKDQQSGLAVHIWRLLIFRAALVLRLSTVYVHTVVVLHKKGVLYFESSPIECRLLLTSINLCSTFMAHFSTFLLVQIASTDFGV